MSALILAIDQGTTSTRAMLVSEKGDVVSWFQVALTQYFPKAGWVEHDPEEIWQTTLQCLHAVTASVNIADIAAIGITNQRETTVLWDKTTGKPVYNAIVWQDRRTSEYCEQLIKKGFEPVIQQKTGLLLDPYFSASKIVWIIESIPAAKKLCQENNLCFGTIDSFLLWRLSHGNNHYTDVTNAARTLLFNIHTLEWDPDLLKIFNIPAAMLPTVLANAANFGLCNAAILGKAIPITAMIGDQQAASVGQACFEEGMIKSTYGTGCFILMNTGTQCLTSNHRLLVTPQYRLNSLTNYAIEGSIFIAGAAILWLKDNLQVLDNAAQSEVLAASVDDTDGVIVVPALTGLGAPYWDPHARGAILGLTRHTQIAHIVRATLESIAFQTQDLLITMSKENIRPTLLCVDGGMAENNWLMQFLADILQIDVERPKLTQTTALGAAFIAGLQCGVFKDLEQCRGLWQPERTFKPTMEKQKQVKLYQTWLAAVKAVQSMP